MFPLEVQQGADGAIPTPLQLTVTAMYSAWGEEVVTEDCYFGIHETAPP